MFTKKLIEIPSAHTLSETGLSKSISNAYCDLKYGGKLKIIAIDPLLKGKYPFYHHWRTLSEIQRKGESAGFHTVETGAHIPKHSFKWVGKKLKSKFKGAKKGMV